MLTIAAMRQLAPAKIIWVGMTLGWVGLAGCQSVPTDREPVTEPASQVEAVASQELFEEPQLADTSSASPAPYSDVVLAEHRIEGLGAAQGLMVHQGKVYLYGDAQTGVIREYTFDDAANQLDDTGREIKLTFQGEDLASHPTGLTVHPRFGAFLGDTVNRQGAIYQIDWQRALADGHLDNALISAAKDDIAANGTRPEWVRFMGRWVIATGDYGNKNNRIRLYDPDMLQTNEQTSAPGVLIASWPSPPFVQSIHWIDRLGTMVLVRNRTPGKYHALTFLKLPQREGEQLTVNTWVPGPWADELEGFGIVSEGKALLLSAGGDPNLRVIKLDSVPPKAN